MELEEREARAKGFADYYLREKGLDFERYSLEFGFIKGLEAGETTTPWVSTKQRLPDSDNFYLVHEKRTGHIQVQWFNKCSNEDVFGDNCAYDFWMPIPMLPKSISER